MDEGEMTDGRVSDGADCCRTSRQNTLLHPRGARAAPSGGLMGRHRGILITIDYN
jgi:hypothetical protein